MTEEQILATANAIALLKQSRARLFAAHVTGNTPKEPAHMLNSAILLLQDDIEVAPSRRRLRKWGQAS